MWMILVAGLVLAAIAGGYLLFGKASDPYRTMSALPVADYLQNSNSLRGNVYKIEGTVSQSLKALESKGLLVKTQDTKDKRSVHLQLTAPARALLDAVMPPDFLVAAAQRMGTRSEDLEGLLLELLRHNRHAPCCWMRMGLSSRSIRPLVHTMSLF